MTPEDQTQFRLLRALEQHPEYNQRELSHAVGISLGRTNYVIRALIEKGMVKMGRFLGSDKKLTKTAYFLTPAGLKLRLELTHAYVERKKQEYAALKSELEALELEKQGR
jgi:EPS-associated MarR family transcriptional regulator